MTDYTPVSHQLVAGTDEARIYSTLTRLVATIELKPLLLELVKNELDGAFIPLDLYTCKGLSPNTIYMASQPQLFGKYKVSTERFFIPLKDRT